MQNNSVAELILGGFTASKIWQLFQRAVIFLADFRRTNIPRRIRRSAAAEGSNDKAVHYTSRTSFLLTEAAYKTSLGGEECTTCGVGTNFHL